MGMGTHRIFAQINEAGSDTTYKTRILLLPAIGSSPETGFLFGGVVVPQFKMKGSGPGTRSSSVFISVIYTLKKQVLTSILPDIIFPGERWVLNGNYYANYYPDSYWGVGPDTRNSDEIRVLFTEVNLEQSVLHRIYSGFFAGPYLRWSRVGNVKFKNTDGVRITPPNVQGADGSRSAGFGFIIRWDKRNSNMTPIHHHYLEFSVLFNPSWLGSTAPYTAYKLDARKYFDLQGNGLSVLALQSLFRLTSGNPPFRDMSMIGGDMINRGYFEGRYRDRNAGQVQAEFRQNVIGRLGFTVFAGGGQVWNRFSGLELSDFKWTAGGGLRFNLNKEDPTNLRIDYGIGRKTSGFYIQFGEAF